MTTGKSGSVKYMKNRIYNMKATIRIVLCAAVAMMAFISCQKNAVSANPAEESKGTIDIRIGGLMGEYSQVDGTKAELVNTVRVSWEGGETVYVYDGIQCLGSLKATLEGAEDRYALLSTDETHTVNTPAEGTTKLTLVYSPLLAEAPAVSNNAISISLAEQNGAKAPFVVYATLDYSGASTIIDAVVPFKFATSVIKVNCTGLKASTAITSATLSNVNTACKLALSGAAEPAIMGETNGIITRTDDTNFAAGKVNAEGEAVFQIAVPKLKSTDETRVLSILQGSDMAKDHEFTKKSLDPATSVNTICQMVNVPAGALPGVFSVSNDNGVTIKKVYFSKGNLYWNGSTFNFEENQYDYPSSWDETHVSLFYWSKTESVAYSEFYSDSTADESDVFFTNETESTAKSDFTVNGVTGKYRTLSNTEWHYLINNSIKKVGVTVCGQRNCLVLAPDNWKGDILDYYDVASWIQAEANGLVCLPSAGWRYGEPDVMSTGDMGEYWSSTAGYEEIAYQIYFDALEDDMIEYRYSGCSVRLVTEAK